MLRCTRIYRTGASHACTFRHLANINLTLISNERARARFVHAKMFTPIDNTHTHASHIARFASSHIFVRTHRCGKRLRPGPGPGWLVWVGGNDEDDTDDNTNVQKVPNQK